MDLTRLSYFAAVAEAGSFSRAAAALHLSQPALSRQVLLLEGSWDSGCWSAPGAAWC
ncbi:LysR family transcriptional regulator [Delftia lacustris]|uniref:LysR family transcriptional regulator n=1 Tax=Delftia lacustris TaxID=558537 RepID=UPI001EEFD83C|nr:LysR family transcriptional regulator [Delftia lacustris]